MQERGAQIEPGRDCGRVGLQGLFAGDAAWRRGMEFDVTIEIPMGQRNKYEMDHATG